MKWTLAAIVLAVALVPLQSLAAQTAGGVYNAYATGQAVHDRGEVHGVVASVDYGGGLIVVDAGGHRYRIAVLPSTQIYVHNQYATLADVVRGARISARVNEVGGRLVAQIIRL